MDLAQYITLRQRQHLLQDLREIAAAEGKGYARNIRGLAQPTADPFARLGRAAGAVMTTGLARRAILQRQAATSAGQSLQPSVIRAHTALRQRLAREQRQALLDRKRADLERKAAQGDRIRTATILKHMAALERSLKKKKKK